MTAPAVATPPVAALATKPVGARTSISRSDAGTLLVEVPPTGFNAAGSLMGGAFTAAWFSAIVPATGTMIATGGASALFMLPFWLAGGVVAKQTVVDPVKATSLSIGEFAWELQQRAVGLPLSSAAGASDELDGCSVEIAAYVNAVGHAVTSSGTRSDDTSKLAPDPLETLRGDRTQHVQLVTRRAERNAAALQ